MPMPMPLLTWQMILHMPLPEWHTYPLPLYLLALITLLWYIPVDNNNNTIQLNRSPSQSEVLGGGLDL
jgi:hypothetical protein